jgi:hypothetical protein
MPTISDNYHDNLIETMKDLANNSRWFASSINLGGVPGSGGGSGGPPGGFYGQLIQSQVAYDTTEASISGGPVASGWSLVDNLNHIRYQISTFSGGTGGQNPIVIQDEGITVVSGNWNVMNFTGAPVTVAYTGGKVVVNISGTGAGGSGVIKVSSDDTTLNYLENKLAAGTKITIATINPGGNEQSQITFAGMALNELSDTSVTTPASGQALAWNSLKWVASGIDFGNASKLLGRYLDTSVPTSGNVLAWNTLRWIPSGIDFGNASKLLGRYLDTTIPASGQVLAWNSLVWVASGLAPGGSSDTKQVKVTVNDTTEGYLQPKIRAGTSVSITLISGGANEFLQVSATGSGFDSKKVLVSSDDTTENYLYDKLYAGTNITLTKIGVPGPGAVQIEATGGGADVLQVQVFS